MYAVAVLIGIYSYSIFLLGIFGFLTFKPILFVTLLFFLSMFYVSTKISWQAFHKASVRWLVGIKKFEAVMLVLMLALVAVNFIGVLGPELSFDALWYHLTFPKLYLATGSIFHIPGGLLYYSDMPKLVEMLYIPAVLFGGETVAKFVHFAFGLGSALVTYKLARKFVSERLALLSCLVFYSNLVIDWLSITAYIDLARTFFEVTAMYYLIDYIQKKKTKSVVISGVILGLAVCTKILSAVDLVSFIGLILLFTKSVKNSLIFLLVTLLVLLPWLVFAYLNTGNPFYPFFSDIYKVGFGLNLSNIINFIHSPDPLSPIYLIFLPVLFIVFKKMSGLEKILVFYSIGSFLIWFVVPQSGGGRFIAPYLPAFSILVVVILAKIENKLFAKYLTALIFVLATVSILYRGAANYKYVPVILGKQTKSEFLSNNLNFKFGDFYDVDGYFKSHLSKNDRVLTIGIHNLYYVDFNFIDESWVKPGDFYDYILTQNVSLPSKYKNVHLVYENNKTGVKLYKI